MRRFFFQDEQRRGASVFLGSKESHHISKVLRLKEGEQVELCDQNGSVFSAEIITTGKTVELALGNCLPRGNSTSGKLIVGQSGIKSKNMEFILQKCTELGVDEFQPFVSARSQGNLIQQYRGKGERWRRIIAEACKQCERPTPMELCDIQLFKDMIDETGDDADSLKLLFWEKEKRVTLHDYTEKLGSDTSVIIIFGPEGGFTEGEVEIARKSGWQTVGLGMRVLRSETAAIAATSLVQHHRGQM